MPQRYDERNADICYRVDGVLRHLLGAEAAHHRGRDRPRPYHIATLTGPPAPLMPRPDDRVDEVRARLGQAARLATACSEAKRESSDDASDHVV